MKGIKLFTYVLAQPPPNPVHSYPWISAMDPVNLATEGRIVCPIGIMDSGMKATTRNTTTINTSPEKLYRAFTDPEALSTWLAPGDMVGKIHRFDPQVGGGYEMSLFYPDHGGKMQGKTSENEDRFTARFVELTPFKRIVQAINFHSSNPDFSGEMMMDVTLEPHGNWTTVTIMFENIPAGIDPKDNEAGTELSLGKLARYMEAN